MQPSSNSAAQQPPTNARSSRELDIRHGSVEIDDAALAPPSEQFTPLPSSSPRSSRAEVAITLESLPSSILSHIGLFAAGGFLSGSCQATLAAIPALHYNIDIAKSASSFGKDKDPTGAKARGHMGLLPTRGALATGRVVTRVSVTGCSRKRSNSGYIALERAVRRVVQHCIPSLQSILVQVIREERPGNVATIIDERVPGFSEYLPVAKKLTRVELCHGSDSIVKAGNAIWTGLWPSLEELVVHYRNASVEHLTLLADGLRYGHAPNLRVLKLDRQRFMFSGMDDVVLAALSAGMCPRIEHVTLAGSHYPLGSSLPSLRGALTACPELRELRMEFASAPVGQVRDLVEALGAGDVPRLRYLCIATPGYLDDVAELETLMDLARCRTPAVRLKVT